MVDLFVNIYCSNNITIKHKALIEKKTQKSFVKFIKSIRFKILSNVA